jgi:UDP-N-acetylmuramoyl-L-alanyl-D-glutamate--2,6-diaminopimelate ligase
MTRLVKELTDSISITEAVGDTEMTIHGLSYDSRSVKPGDLYFALPGLHVDGHDYIEDALDAGAVAVVHAKTPPLYREGVCYLRVKNPRIVMSPISAAFYRHPSESLKIIGVTGTDGKSSTVSFIHQLLSSLGRRTGFLSTVSFNTGDTSVKNHFRQSTPEATEIQKALHTMLHKGCSHAVVESTSHGLSPLNNRLGDVRYNAAVLTNISHEHLDFHGSMERYIDDKANLFRMTARNKGVAVINLDDEAYMHFVEAGRDCSIITYSARGNPEAVYRAEDIRETATSISFTLVSPAGKTGIALGLPGRFNVDNVLSAIAVICETEGVHPENLAASAAALQAVKGRMVPVDEGQPFQVIVDYAHTPGSFRRLFPALRPLVPGRLFSLFSSAGERDLEKRPVLGSIADSYSDVIILADEDPRGERPIDLLRDVAAGCSNKREGETLFLIEDRTDAIRHAFSMMEAGDCILLLGKGHEGSIIYADRSIWWDEEEVARKVLREMGYRKSGGK